MDGIIPLFKPKGPTSHDCVSKLRKMIGQKKIGHTGTLDPEVEGVLPICLGGGTKVIPFLSGHLKEYVAEIYLGASTTTEDATGEIMETMPLSYMPSFAEITYILHNFIGEITQVPPMFSAVKVNGKKLYEYARQGIEVDRPEREIVIRELELLGKDDTRQMIQFRAVCSKGTYIRTLCVDIGKALGYPAHMVSLVRTASDSIMLQETVDFSTLEISIARGDVQKHLLPLDRMLTHMDAMEVNKEQAKKVSFGQKLQLPISGQVIKAKPFKMMHDGKLLAIYKKSGHVIKPVRVFNLKQSDGE